MKYLVSLVILTLILANSDAANPIGCFRDDENDRALPFDYILMPGVNSPAACTQHCANYAYAGMEYGEECYCGNSRPSNQIDDGECYVDCPGDNSVKCGGNWALSVYEQTNTGGPSKRVVCYMGNWAVQRNDGFSIDGSIDANLCTNFIYAFIGTTAQGDIRILDNYLDIETGGYQKFVALRSRNPNARISIAVGGGDDDFGSSSIFSAMVANPDARFAFTNNIVGFMEQHGFDGLDFDWEYPGQNGGNEDTDKENYVQMLRELRARFDTRSPPYLLSAAVAAAEWAGFLSYNIPAMSESLDFINIMAYDFHGAEWSEKTGVGSNAPLYPSNVPGVSPQDNVDASIHYWLSQGAPASKIILGMGTYGHTFQLSDPSINGMGAPYDGPGLSGPVSQSAGSMGYNEVCLELQSGTWNEIWHDGEQVPYAIRGDQWMSYDNVRSIQIKSQYVNDLGLGGAMIWSIEQDDFNARCGGSTFTLLRTIHDYMR